jgi:hypothetical protein
VEGDVENQKGILFEVQSETAAVFKTPLPSTFSKKPEVSGH